MATPTDTAAVEALPAASGAGGQPLRRGGIALVANGAATGLLGLAYWVVAARLYGEVAVGRNASLVSAMLTVSGLAQLNYARSLSGLIPRARERAGHLVGRVYLTVGAVSLVAGGILATVLPILSSRFSYLHPADLVIPGFAVAVVLWSLFTLEDTVLASTRRAAIVPFENALFGATKLLLLYLLASVGFGDLNIFASWVAPLVVIVVPINIYAFRRALPKMSTVPVEVEELPGRWVRHDFAGYMLWLAGTSPLPFLILAVLGARASGSFYIPLTVVTSIDVVSLNVGNAITAEVARSGGTPDRHAARFVVGFWLLVLVGSLVLVFVAPTLLQIFGHRYRTGSGIVLRMLLSVSAFRSAMFLHNALARAAGKGGRILAVQAIAAGSTLSIGLGTMTVLGVKGMALGWLVGSVAAGVLAVVWAGPSVLRSFRSGTAAGQGARHPAHARSEPSPQRSWWRGATGTFRKSTPRPAATSEAADARQ